MYKNGPHEISYTLGVIIGTFATIYLPILLILFVSDRNSEWLKFAFITALIIFPLAYVFSTIHRFMKEEDLTLKIIISNIFDREKRMNKKKIASEKSKKLNEFYEEFERVSQNYENRVSKVLTEEDFKPSNLDDF